MSRALEFADKCRHFNGIQHKECKAGVRYVDVRDSSQPYRLPCLSPYGRSATTECPKRSLLTQEEQQAKYDEMSAAVDAALAKIASGKCHICGADAEPSQIVGRCKYAACGHRIGQVASEDEYP